MRTLKIYHCAIAGRNRQTPIDDNQLNDMLREVNVIFKQVGVRIELGAPLTNIVNGSFSRFGLMYKGVGARIRNLMSKKDGLEVYFIDGFGAPKEPLGAFNPWGIIVRRAASAKTLAHEIGHAYGLWDIYPEASELEMSLNKAWMPDDWNNGTGCRFYKPSRLQSQIIKQLLMYGHGGDAKCDISLGGVYGLDELGQLLNVRVGRSHFMTVSPKSL